MSARAPTDFTYYLDSTGMKPGASILSAPVTQVITDQLFVLKRKELLFSDCHYPIGSTDTAYVTYRTTTHHKGVHFCGTLATNTVYYYVLAWATGASNFTIRISGSTTLSVTTSLTTPTWRGPISRSESGIGEQVASGGIEFKRDSAPVSTICIGGIALYSTAA